MSRLPTQRDGVGTSRLERNETAMSRIATQRSQHSNTVGASAGLRSRTRASRRWSVGGWRTEEPPMPPMGAGKPFPPMLPEREEYVVEFEGVEDPAWPQNWKLKKKYAHLSL